MTVGHGSSLALAGVGLLLLAATPRRVVVIKLDGVPADFLDSVLKERDPRTGKSKLPWIDEIFAHNGTRMANFYVRGISLSVPSWSLLDTGQHQRIHGNVEYDRFTLRPYDYMNFFPFYLGNAMGKRADMPGVEVLDEYGTPLLIDRFEPQERYQSFQLFQRWVHWNTFSRGIKSKLNRSPRDLFDEWQMGFGFADTIFEQQVRELIGKLPDEQVRYLDYFSGDYDHVAHLANDRSVQTAALQGFDRVIGQIWTAIRSSSLRESTVLAVVSDHGMNTAPGTYSQGFSLLGWLGGTSGGGHHTITNRYPMDEYKIRGLNPFVSATVTASRDSSYLQGESDEYPTAAIDVDGNERAAISLRNSDLNMAQVLLKQLARKSLSPRVRVAAENELVELLAQKRESWTRDVAELREELDAVHRAIQRERPGLVRINKDDQEARRRLARVLNWERDEDEYAEYLQSITNLLRVQGPIPKRSLGPANSIYDLQHYIAGPSREGLQTVGSDDTRLDRDVSFQQIDYFAALRSITVRNNVQRDVGTEPVDFIAVCAPAVEGADAAVWLYKSDRRQALVLSKTSADGELSLRYLPIELLRAQPDGSVAYRMVEWASGFPLAIWEDPQLDTDREDRAAWLNAWHPERDWLRAVHRTLYSNGVIGITEQFGRPSPARTRFDHAEEPLLVRFEARQRRLAEADMLVFANDHWNFNVRSFNAGGNHGSFLRISTHAILMFWGGSETGVPRGRVIDEPYDSLSFAPTVLRLAGRDGGTKWPEPVIELGR